MNGTAAEQARVAPRPAIMLGITAAWGLFFLAIRVGLQDALVLWFAALRALIAAAALPLLCLLQGRGLPRERRTWWLITLMGLTNVTVAFSAMFAGTAGMAIGPAAVLANAQPLPIVLPAWVALRGIALGTDPAWHHPRVHRPAGRGMG